MSDQQVDKKNVLVFPCGSEIGLEIFRSVSLSSHFHLVGGSSAEDHGRFIYNDYVGDIAYIDDERFIESINKVVREKNIDLIFPAHDSVVLALSKAENEGLLDCRVVTSPYKTCEIARSKRATYEILKDAIGVPKIFNKDNVKTSDFPVFLKPDVGQGSKGTFKAKDFEDVEFYLNKDKTLLILEYLPGKEYTVDCFTNMYGELIFSEARERSRIQNGISVNSITVEDNRFLDLAKKINEKIKFRGVWFFQVKENTDGDLILMEIAPRVAGTMGLVRVKGVNLALMSLFDALEINVGVLENKFDITIDRALENNYRHNINYDSVYVDLDDTLIVDGKVNTLLVGFLYQCINKGVKIHLLTRHKLVLNDTLNTYRLTGVFDDMTVIDDEAPKASFITSENAIFIDDSFAERKAVSKQLGIPVFDPHAIEGLRESL